MAGHGYRAIAHDRRGGGRSGQTWGGNDLDTYADDLAQLLEHLNLHDVVLGGHSTGGGEVARCAAARGAPRVSKLLLLSAFPPVMLKTDGNPEGLPIEVWDMFWLWSMSVGIKGAYDCVKAFSETDQTEDLKRDHRTHADHPR